MLFYFRRTFLAGKRLHMYISSFSSTVSPPTEADHSIDSSCPSMPVRADLPSRSPSHDHTPESQ